MITHYAPRGGQVACGRNNHDLNSTPQPAGVRCKKCLSSHSFKQGLWFDEFQKRTGTEAIGLEDWSDGTSTFSVAAQYSIDCFLREAEEMAQGLERDLRPLVVNDIG